MYNKLCLGDTAQFAPLIALYRAGGAKRSLVWTTLQNKMDKIKLDNPTWYSLTETHKDFAIDYNGIKFYQPDYRPFGGFTQQDTTKTGIDNYALLIDNFYVVGDRPIFDDRVQLKKQLVCSQMLLDK